MGGESNGGWGAEVVVFVVLREESYNYNLSTYSCVSIYRALHVASPPEHHAKKELLNLDVAHSHPPRILLLVPLGL